jgi:hypothetical protein
MTRIDGLAMTPTTRLLQILFRTCSHVESIFHVWTSLFVKSMTDSICHRPCWFVLLVFCVMIMKCVPLLYVRLCRRVWIQLNLHVPIDTLWYSSNLVVYLAYLQNFTNLFMCLKMPWISATCHRFSFSDSNFLFDAPLWYERAIIWNDDSQWNIA